MILPGKNFVFIDTQNIYMALQELGWRMDWKKFFVYLREHYSANRAYFFVGYLPEHASFYRFLQRVGYVLIFKEVVRSQGKIKGNVDVELAVQAMIDLPHYDAAIVVSNDGDFSYLLQYLLSKNKLKTVLAISPVQCSRLLKKAAGKKIQFLENAKEFLRYKN